jgi:uncharacterized protein involved in exopolysaccharide biosynthesis
MITEARAVRNRAIAPSAHLHVLDIIEGFRTRWQLFIFMAYLLIVTPTYSASAHIFYVPRNQQMQSSSSMLSRVGALYGFETSNSSRDFAIAVLKSRHLARTFIERNNLLPLLFPSDWRKDKKKWKSGIDYNSLLARGTNKFKEMIGVSSDPRSGEITVNLSLTNKNLVASTVNNYIEAGDEMLRNRALAQSESRLNFLESQLRTTNTMQVRSAIINLIEHELQEITLAKSSGPFDFEFVDKASPPLSKAWPRPLLLLLLTTVLAAIFAAGTSIFLDVKKSGLLGK